MRPLPAWAGPPGPLLPGADRRSPGSCGSPPACRTGSRRFTQGLVASTAGSRGRGSRRSGLVLSPGVSLLPGPPEARPWRTDEPNQSTMAVGASKHGLAWRDSPTGRRQPRTRRLWELGPPTLPAQAAVPTLRPREPLGGGHPAALCSSWARWGPLLVSREARGGRRAGLGTGEPGPIAAKS